MQPQQRLGTTVKLYYRLHDLDVGQILRRRDTL